MAEAKSSWRLIAIAIAVVFLLALGLAVLMASKDSGIVIAVNGTPGCKFRGVIEVDNVRREVSGTVPAEFRLARTRIAYVLRKAADGDEELTIVKTVQGQNCGGGGNRRGGVVGGLVIRDPGLYLFGELPLRKLDARWW